MVSALSSRGISYTVYPSRLASEKTLVLVMGYSGSAAAWPQSFIEALRLKFRVITLDNRGTGRSPKPREKEAYAIEHLAQDLGSVLNEIGTKDFALLGYSLGGCIALEYAVQNLGPQPQSLILVSSVAGGSAYVPPPGDTLARLESPQGNTALELSRWIWEICMSPAKVDEHLEALKATMPTERELFTPRYALSGQLATYRAFDRNQKMKFPFPVTIITGDSDPLTPPQNSHHLAQLISSSQLHLIPNCEHMPYLEQPAAFLQIIAQAAGV